jgi:hypothetical protein
MSLLSDSDTPQLPQVVMVPVVSRQLVPAVMLLTRRGDEERTVLARGSLMMASGFSAARAIPRGVLPAVIVRRGGL